LRFFFVVLKATMHASNRAGAGTCSLIIFSNRVQTKMYPISS
jgi:hypothetical protein